MSHPLEGTVMVDLSLTVSEELPCTWPGHMLFQHKTFTWFAARHWEAAEVLDRLGSGYQTRWLLMDEHTATHFDAPSHFIPPPGSGLPDAAEVGATDTAEIPLERLTGPAAVLDVRDLVDEADRSGVSPPVTPERVTAFEDRHGRLQPGDAVLLWSGWDRFYRPGNEGRRWAELPLSGVGAAWPAPDVATIELLHERGVRLLGTDGASVGPAEGGGPVHVAGLSRGMLFVEALGRLDAVPPRGATFLFLPVRVSHGTGGPGRAVALLPSPHPG